MNLQQRKANEELRNGVFALFLSFFWIVARVGKGYDVITNLIHGSLKFMTAV